MSNLKACAVVTLLIALMSKFSVDIINFDPNDEPIHVEMDSISPQMTLEASQRAFLEEWTQYSRERQDRSMYIMFMGRHLYVEFCPDCGNNGTYQIYHAVEGYEYSDRFEPTIQELEKQLRLIDFQYYTEN
jgi:hypothetical protein